MSRTHLIDEVRTGPACGAQVGWKQEHSWGVNDPTRVTCKRCMVKIYADVAAWEKKRKLKCICSSTPENYNPFDMNCPVHGEEEARRVCHEE